MAASRRVALAFIALLVAWPALAADAPALRGAALGGALRHGGYVLYFRHASTDFGQNDDAMTSFENCAQQRNLTAKGRDEARAIGAGLARAHVPVDTVLASPYCRTRETARLIFGRETVDNAVRGGPASAEGGRYDALKALLSKPVPPGTNIAIVSHGNPFHAVAPDASYLAEGEAAVIEPLGEKGFRIVGRIARDGWETLAQ
jgi:phosphohistidine phosphatase SixA